MKTYHPTRRVAGAVALALAVVAAVPAAALAATPPAGVETRAGLAPALTAGRGSTLPFVEQEAENAATTGEVIGADRATNRDAYTLPAEASGRRAVKLDKGENVTFTLTKPANAVTIRYALPDAPNGGGLSGTLNVTAGKLTIPAPVTSKYSYLYNQYPFTNDPNAGLLHDDWWLTECACVPKDSGGYTPAKPFRPFHFYAEQRVPLIQTLKAGAKVTVTLPKSSALPWAVVDVVDFEQVGLPKLPPLKHVNAWLYGADPTGRKDAAPALDKAIAAAKKIGWPVYVPPGVYQVNRHIVVDNVTILGAGNWYTTFQGKEVALPTQAPDGSVHTGVGFYGKYAADGGSRNVVLKDFAIIGDVAERIDTDQVNGIGGALSDSTIDGLYIARTKVGVWVDGPMKNLTVKNSVIVDQIADGLNFHKGVTDSTATNNVFRNSGDDTLAMWAEGTTNARNTFSRNTVQSPTLANGIAIYGGKDITVAGNLVADPVREGSGLHLGSRFGAEPFAGRIALTDNTVVRAGTYELNWNIGLGALWVYALDKSIDADIQVTGDHFLDSTYNALMLVTEFGVKDTYRIDGVKFKDLRIDGTGTSVLSARTAGTASFQNVDARNVGAVGTNNCGAFNWDWANGSEFRLTDLGGNDGLAPTPGGWGEGPANWLTRYLPNIITCDDRPAKVVPPAPSSW